MGISSFPISFLLAATPLPVEPVEAPAIGPVSTPVVAPVPMAMEEGAYRQVLQSGDLATLDGACRDAARFGLNERMRELRDRLMVVAPAPQPFTVVTANARALLECRAPDSAQRVLSRYGPGAGARRREWLLLSWRAAAAALDHDAAILALRRLADGQVARLETMQLVVGEGAEGLPLTRSALDQLAEHEAAAGRIERAAAVALSGVSMGRVGAERMARAALWLEALGQHDATNLLEAALDQAAVAEAWALAEELLRLQLRLERKSGGDGARPRSRLERLATRVDDRYTLWQLLRGDSSQPVADPRRADLEQRLRSPRSPGGWSSLGQSEQPGASRPISPLNP